MILLFLKKYKLVRSVFTIIGRWYDFGNVDDKLLVGTLTGLGLIFTMYLCFDPRKVRKSFAHVCILFYLQHKVTNTKLILYLQNIGRKGAKNIFEPSVGYF